MASPIVAGATALVLNLYYQHTNKYPSPEMVEEIIKRGAQEQNHFLSFVQGGGSLDLSGVWNEARVKICSDK
jgi:subtilisin family serine protease